MKNFSVSAQEIKMSKRGVRLMNVGIIEDANHQNCVLFIYLNNSNPEFTR